MRVIGVQADSSPAAYLSWKQQKLLAAPNRSFAEGLSTGSAFELPQRMMWTLLKEFVLVSDDEIRHALVWMIEHAHTLAEAAGAAALAAAFKMRSELAGKKVAVVCSGGNTSLASLKRSSCGELISAWYRAGWRWYVRFPVTILRRQSSQ